MMTLLAQTANAAQSLESLHPIGVIEDASRHPACAW